MILKHHAKNIELYFGYFDVSQNKFDGLPIFYRKVIIFRIKFYGKQIKIEKTKVVQRHGCCASEHH